MTWQANADRPTSGPAIASLIFGVDALLMPQLFAIVLPAVVLGIVGLIRTSSSGRRGRWMAITGICLGGYALLGLFGFVPLWSPLGY
jgi:hypothetical protein